MTVKEYFREVGESIAEGMIMLISGVVLLAIGLFMPPALGATGLEGLLTLIWAPIWICCMIMGMVGLVLGPFGILSAPFYPFSKDAREAREKKAERERKKREEQERAEQEWDRIEREWEENEAAHQRIKDFIGQNRGDE